MAKSDLPAKPTRRHGAIARRLGTAIVTGEYKPGQVLETEIAFSEQLQVSRSAYREALRTLAAKGLVESRTKTGTTVCARSRWNLLDPDVLSWVFENEPSPDLVRNLFELRMIVEPEVAALAAERRDATQVTRMRQALQRMEQHGLETQEGRDADIEFHEQVLEAASNPLLAQLSTGITAAVRWTTIFKARRSALPRDPMGDHWAVFDAIAAGGPDAARAAMRTLVSGALRDTESSLRPRPAE